MEDGSVTIRAWRAQDRGPVGTLLARAFLGDPAWQFVFEDDAEPGLAFLMPRLLALRAEGGATMRVAEAEGTPVGVIVWGGQEPRGLWAQFRHGLLRFPIQFGLPATRRLRDANLRVGALERTTAPSAPHVYFQQLAVDPRWHGRGIARALMKDGLAAADAAGLPAYLLTTRDDNVKLYQRSGFSVVGQDGIAKSFTTFAMIRPARSS